MDPLPSEGGFLLCTCVACFQSGLSFPAAFCLAHYGGQIILIRAGDLGTSEVGRKRAGWISWDEFPQEYKHKEPGLCWQPGKQ